ncbi:RNA polymerase sigma factor [Sphingobacterium psychroaquaticum]|uniref:RNA polymerase sigma factor n=1 Tax=Sphingobacterium psychroaquaticum TaxID=561061 RepID=UPI00141B145D|nr:sigma-70 family RNA polymerase sigma factor [Sphingobacterium psychroaquaticum]
MGTGKINRSVLSLFTEGDKEAFEFIYRECSALIYRRLVYILKDTEDAKEVLQAVFVKLWIGRESIDTERNFEHYLYRMADSMAIDLIRRNTRSNAIFNTLFTEHDLISESMEDQYVRREDWSILEEAIEQLPPQQKLTFRLCKLEGKSYDEVSKLLNISTSTISNHLVAATKTLRQFTAKYHKELKIILLWWILKEI